MEVQPYYEIDDQKELRVSQAVFKRKKRVYHAYGVILPEEQFADKPAWNNSQYEDRKSGSQKPHKKTLPGDIQAEFGQKIRGL